MTPEQSAAYVYAQSVCALAEIEAMKALNMQRAACGHSMAYVEEAFLAVIDKYGISHNAVLTTFGG